MKTKAAVMRASSGDFEITEPELDPPKANEVLVRSSTQGCAARTSTCGTAIRPSTRRWRAVTKGPA